MPEAPSCCSVGQGECDKTQCTCGDIPFEEENPGEMLPGCGISFILKPMTHQHGSDSPTRFPISTTTGGPTKFLKSPSKYSKSPTRLLKSPSKYSNSPTRLLKSPSKYSNSPTRLLKSPSKYSQLLKRPSKYSNSPTKLSRTSSKFSICTCRRSYSPSKQSDTSTSSTKTVHRLKMELEVCTEQMMPQKCGVSMTCLVKWNIAKVVEKHPSIDLEKAIHDCQKKLDIEPCTGQYCLPRSLANPESEEDRHISCALLAWQAKGETDVDKLVVLAEKIREETKNQDESNFAAPRKRSPTNPSCPPNQLSRDEHEQMSDFSKKEFNLMITEAFHLQELKGSPHISRKPSQQSQKSWRERKVSKFCASSKTCSGNNADLVGPVDVKQFYEGLAGPVIKLPDSCPCDFKEFPPESSTKESKVGENYKAPVEKEGQGDKQQLDIPVCLEGRCIERLRTLDQAVGALRQRAARLAKRDQIRKELLERAEKAWQDMEQGFQKQLALANEKEEEITEKINKLLSERNSWKNSCLCGETDLENQNKLLRTAEAGLSRVISAIQQAEDEKHKLEKLWKKLDGDIDKEKMIAHNKQKELTFTEERLRTRLKSLSEDLEVQQKLTADVNRALIKELESLKEQFSVVSKQLLQADDQNAAMKAKVLAQIKERKVEITEALESCKARCGNKYDSVKKELEQKNKELDKKKQEAFACSCKLPIDRTCQVRRTPSFVAACRCTKPHSGKSCSCTSLKTRMMKDLLKDIFEGMRDEISEGTAMPCELLKCMEDGFDWDADTPLKRKIRDFFEDLLHNELDIAIMTAIEQYHARWTNDSCVDKPKESKVIVMRVEKTASMHHSTMTSAPKPQSQPDNLSPLPLGVEDPWTRTQADVVQLSTELKQLKRKSIRRRDLQAMEQNFTKIVQNIVKPRRRSKAEKSTAMTPRSTDTFTDTSHYKTDQIEKSNEHRRDRSSSKVSKDVVRSRKINPSTKLSLLKHRSKNAHNRLDVPSFDSTDLCLSPKDPQRQEESALRSLLNNLYLDTDIVSLARVKEHKRENTPSTSKKKPSIPPLNKNEIYFCESECLAKDNVPKMLTKPTLTQQFSPEVLAIQNSSSYHDKRKENKARRRRYNQLISECMQSFKRGQIPLKSKDNALNVKYLYEEKDNAKQESHFDQKRSQISIDNETGSFTSWKTAQDEDIRSLVDSVCYSKTCIANNKIPLDYKYRSSTKTIIPYNSAIAKEIEILSNNDVIGNAVNMNPIQYNYDKPSVGVYFLNKLCNSITSIFSGNKNKSECSCNTGNIRTHIKSIRGDKSKQTGKSEQNRLKLKFKDTKKKLGKSTTSLKSKTSLASSTKSKYHKWCTLDSSAREALKRKTKLKKKSSICKPCIKSETSNEPFKVEQAGVQTCSDVCNKACQCDINTKEIKPKIDKSSSMGDKIKTYPNIGGIKACLCEFKSIGASLIRDKNAARVYGGDRFGIGPFRGIFGPDQRPLGEAQKFPLECEGEAKANGGREVVEAGGGQAVVRSRSSGTVEQRGLSHEVTESGRIDGKESSGDGIETLTITHRRSPSEPCGTGNNAAGSKVSSRSKFPSYSDDAKVIICRSKSQSSSKRESFICKDELSSDRRSLAIGLHKCLCGGSVASAQIQTSKHYLSSEDDDNDEECICCSKSDKQKSKDLETNAFQLLQQYILSKIKKMKCECCPILNSGIDENAMYKNLLEKIQGVISKDIGRLACRCKDQNDMENNEYMAFSLLEEYIKSKLQEMMCSCNAKDSDVSPDFYAEVLDTIKNVIENDLEDIKCCCHTLINQCPCSKSGDIERKSSVILNQNSVSDKMCETCFYDQISQTGGNEVKSKSSECIEGIKKLIGRISGINLSSDRENLASKKASMETAVIQTSFKSFTGGRKSKNSNEVESIWCKCLPDRNSSNLYSGVVTSSADLTSSKQSFTGKQDKQYNKKCTSSDKCNNGCPCSQKVTSGPQISQERRNSKQNFSAINRIPVEKQKSSSRQSSPDLDNESRKNSRNFNHENLVRVQSGSTVISNPRVGSSEICDICKMESKNLCPVCKTITTLNSPNEVRDLMFSQGKRPCGCDVYMKPCACQNINQRQESNAMNFYSQVQPNGNTKQNFNDPNNNFNRIPVEKQKSSSRQSSPELNNGSRKNSVSFNREDSARVQSGSGVIPGPRLVTNELCDVCKMQGKNVCPVCKSITSPNSPSEVRDLMYPFQGKRPCGCDHNMKSCTCPNVNQRKESNVLNLPNRPNSYEPNSQNPASNVYQRNAPNMYDPAQNAFGPIEYTVPQYQVNTNPGQRTDTSFISATNGGPEPNGAYDGANLECACGVYTDPCRCSNKLTMLEAGRGLGGKYSAKDGFVNGGKGGATNGRRASVTNDTLGGVNQVKPSPKCCGTCKKKAERANKSSKPSKMHCDCSAKF